MNLDELHSKLEITHELNWDAMLEKIVLISVAYFCLGTELWFISLKSKQTSMEESESWHAKALWVACKFLPQGCPLVDHIV